MSRVLLVVASLVAVAPAEASDRPSDPSIEVREVTFDSGGVELAGRLWLPGGPGPHPAAVFIPGSGRSIRNLDLDPDPVPFHLVEQGVAFLAWDKRGVRDSGGAFEPLAETDADAQLARLRLLAADAVAAMRYLAGRDDIDDERIGVWAFSQGGWVASQLEGVGAEPRFVIIVGGPAVSIGEEARYSKLADAAKRASREGEERIDMDALYARLDEVRAGGGNFRGYDPYPYLETMKTPTLFLLGEYDLSVPTRRSVDQLEELGARHEWIDYRVFPRANHGVATQDAAGEWYMAEEFYETQFDFLGNLGVIDRHILFDIAIDEGEP